MGRVIKARATTRLTDDDAFTLPVRAAVMELAVAMAKRIVGDEVKNNPRILEKIFAGALAAARGLEGATVLVHPSDRSESNIDEAATALGFTVRTEPCLLRGGCKIVGRYGEIDATVETITEAFKTVLEGAK